MLLKTYVGKIFDLVLLLLPAAPPILVLFAIAQAGSLPDLDYWYTIEKFTDEQGLRLDYHFLTLHSNEHLIPLAGVIYLLNILFNHGSNIGLSLVTWCMGLMQIPLLIALLPPSCTSSTRTRRLWWLIVSVFVFTPKAYHNWLRGMSGVCWVTANSFAILALYCFVQVSRSFSWSRCWAAATSATAAALSYSTGLMAWPMLGAGSLLLWRRERRPLYLFSAIALPLVIVVVLSFGHPHREQTARRAVSLFGYIKFCLSLLGGTSGSPLIGGCALAIVIGCALLVIYYDALKDRWNVAWPWLLITTYPLLNAIVSAIFRAGRPVDSASASRYGTLPSLFLLSVLALIAAFLPRRLQSQLMVGVITCGLILGVTPYIRFRKEIREEFIYQERKKLAALSLILNSPDQALLVRSTTLEPGYFNTLVSRLKAMHHVPYDGSAKLCPEVGTLTSTESAPAEHEVELGRAIPLRPRNRQRPSWRIQGFLKSKRALNSSCILFIDSNERVVGQALRTRNALCRSREKRDSKSSAWSGYVIGAEIKLPLRIAVSAPTPTLNGSVPVRVVSAPFLFDLSTAQ